MDFVVLSPEEFDGLPEHQTPPYETKVGIRWRTNLRPHDPQMPHWMLGEFVEHADPGKLGIAWRTILVKSTGQGVGEGLDTLCNPDPSEIAANWERQGGAPIGDTPMLDMLAEAVFFWSPGSLTTSAYSPAMTASWVRIDGNVYLTIRRASQEAPGEAT